MGSTLVPCCHHPLCCEHTTLLTSFRNVLSNYYYYVIAVEEFLNTMMCLSVVNINCQLWNIEPYYAPSAEEEVGDYYAWRSLIGFIWSYLGICHGYDNIFSNQSQLSLTLTVWHRHSVSSSLLLCFKSPETVCLMGCYEKQPHFNVTTKFIIMLKRKGFILLRAIMINLRIILLVNTIGGSWKWIVLGKWINDESILMYSQNLPVIDLVNSHRAIGRSLVSWCYMLILTFPLKVRIDITQSSH